jgi:hypothetical protein
MRKRTSSIFENETISHLYQIETDVVVTYLDFFLPKEVLMIDRNQLLLIRDEMGKDKFDYIFGSFPFDYLDVWQSAEERVDLMINHRICDTYMIVWEC